MSRIMVVESEFRESPWAGPGPLAGASPNAALYLRDYGQRRNLERQDAWFGVGVSGQVEFYFPGPGEWRFAIRTLSPVVACQKPMLRLHFRVDAQASSRVSWFLGKLERVSPPGEHAITTDFAYHDGLSKYSGVPPIILKVTGSGAGRITFLHARFEAEEETEEQARVASMRSIPPPSLLVPGNPLTIETSRSAPLEIHCCEGEPVAVRVVFDAAIPQARLALALYPMQDRRWRWEARGAKGEAYLIDDPRAVVKGADRESGQKPSINVKPGDAAWVTFTAATRRTRLDRFWLNTVATKTGAIRVLSGGKVVREIALTIHMYKYPVMQTAPAVAAGIYVAGERYGPGTWDAVHRWLARAGVTWATNPVGVGRWAGSEGYGFDDLFACMGSRGNAGMRENAILSNALLSYEIGRIAEGKNTWPGQVEESVRTKFGDAFSTVGTNLWAYSRDEAQGDDLREMIPFWAEARAAGVPMYAALHAHEWEKVPETRDAIRLWIMTERNWIMNERLRGRGQLSALYGYPFSDVHGFDVQRRPWMEAWASRCDIYMQYALNAWKGAAFAPAEAQGLIIPGASADGTNLVETVSALGWLQGIVDMRYIALARRASEGLRTKDKGLNPEAIAAAEAASDFIESLTPNVDMNAARIELIGHLNAMTKAGWRG